MAGSDELPPGSTEVEFNLDPVGEGTRLRLVHRRLPEGEVPRHREGWAHFLARLALASSGADPWGEQASVPG